MSWESHLDEGEPGDDSEAGAEGGQHPPVTRGEGQVTLLVVIIVRIRHVNEASSARRRLLVERHFAEWAFKYSKLKWNWDTCPQRL